MAERNADGTYIQEKPFLKNPNTGMIFPFSQAIAGNSDLEPTDEAPDWWPKPEAPAEEVPAEEVPVEEVPVEEVPAKGKAKK